MDKKIFLTHCKHSTNEDLNIKRKGDPKSRTLSRTSDTTETRNLCVIKVILLACFTYIDIFHSKWLLLLKIKMNSNFNCSYMAMSSLTYILVLFCEIFQPVYSV